MGRKRSAPDPRARPHVSASRSATQSHTLCSYLPRRHCCRVLKEALGCWETDTRVSRQSLNACDTNMTSTWCAFFKDEKTPATYFRGLKYLSDGSLRNHVTMRVRYPHIAGGRGWGELFFTLIKIVSTLLRRGKKNPNSPYIANRD